MIEIWKPVKDFEGLYEVSNMGRVKSLERIVKSPRGCTRTIREKILKHGVSDRGYFYVVLCKNGIEKGKRISRLVAQHFIKNPYNKLEVNHKKGIKSDNRASQLEWNTRAENVQHSYKTKLNIGLCGEKNGRCKLNEKQVRLIKHLKNCRPKMKQLEVAKIFNISISTIASIYQDRNWKHIRI